MATPTALSLRPHGLAEEPSDPTTRRLHNLIPQTWQRGFPRAGLFKTMSDGAVCLAALAMPQHAPRFLRLGAAQTSHAYGPDPEHLVHVIDLHPTVAGTGANGNSKADEEATAPQDQDDVLVFVHGGAWGSGKPWMYRLSAVGLAQRLRARYVAVVQYPVYPASSILEQRDCVCAALRYLRKGAWLPPAQQTVAAAGKTKTRLILSGHSSGANICALALLQAAKAGRRVADVFVSLAGVFDVAAHYSWERSRGVHLLSPMGPAAGGDESRHWECSPTVLLQQLPPAPAPGAVSAVAAFLPIVLLLHGTEDTTVPVTSSQDMALELARHGVAVVTSFPAVAHVHPVLELMQEWKEGAAASGGPCCDALLLWHQRLLSSTGRGGAGGRFQAKL